MLPQVNRLVLFDVGGTSIRAGVAVDGRLGAIATRSSASVRAAADPVAALATLLGALAHDVSDRPPDGIVLALPGPVVGGRVTALPTLLAREGALDGVALAKSLWPGAHIWVCNDLTAAGYGFVAAGHDDCCVATCGSGIGAKLFVGGRALLGAVGMGGEIGHWRVPGAPPIACECGGAGHLGALASGRGALALARHRAAQDPEAFGRSLVAERCRSAAALTTEALVAAFRSGDAWTVEGIRQSAEALGSALALIHLAAATPRFFITGGFATALGAGFAALVAEAAEAACWSTGLAWSEAVEVAAPDVEWGLVGGIAYAARARPDHAPCG